MHIGLFLGTFNPIHTGHLIIAQYMLDYTELNEIWFIVSPQNPLKDKDGLLEPQVRFEMIKLAIQDESPFKVSDVEFALPSPSYTIDTLRLLSSEDPSNKYSVIMGSDNLLSIKKWKDYKEILADYHIYVYPRPNIDNAALIEHKNVSIHDVPLLYVSASFIRNAIRNNTSVKHLLPEKVHSYILKNKLFR